MRDFSLCQVAAVLMTMAAFLVGCGGLQTSRSIRTPGNYQQQRVSVQPTRVNVKPVYSYGYSQQPSQFDQEAALLMRQQRLLMQQQQEMLQYQYYHQMGNDIGNFISVLRD